MGIWAFNIHLNIVNIIQPPKGNPKDKGFGRGLTNHQQPQVWAYSRDLQRLQMQKEHLYCQMSN